jgi:hypothetical protein
MKPLVIGVAEQEASIILGNASLSQARTWPRRASGLPPSIGIVACHRAKSQGGGREGLGGRGAHWYRRGHHRVYSELQFRRIEKDGTGSGLHGIYSKFRRRRARGRGAPALGPLHAAGASDLEFGASVRERNERRRRLLSVLVRRMAADRKLRPRMLDDLIDVLFALTSFPFFSQLTARGRSAQAACDLIQGLATDAVRRPLGVA